MEGYEHLDAIALAQGIQKKLFSPLEVLHASIHRIEKMNPLLNCITYKMYEEAQRVLAQGLPEGPLHGVPFLLKDSKLSYAGVPTSYGSRATQHFTLPYDSELVTRYKKAGLVILGKTSLPEFGLSVTTEPLLFGSTKNPWDLTKTCGGSSGGSAAAVAARLVPAAYGSDAAGSIRIPAACCGVFGLKPSRGRLPTGPDLGKAWQGLSEDHVLTRSVRDSALFLDVSKGADLGAPFYVPDTESYLTQLQKPPTPLRIAFSSKPFLEASVDPICHSALTQTVRLCEDLGHQMTACDLIIDSDQLFQVLLTIIAVETSVMLDNFQQHLRIVFKKEDLEAATYFLSRHGKHYTGTAFAKATQDLDRLTRQSARFFESYDILLTPTLAQLPPKLGVLGTPVFEERLKSVANWIPEGVVSRILERNIKKIFGFTPFTPLFNVTGQPAMSMPVYWHNNQFPVGVQAIARFGKESTLFQLAQQLEFLWIDRSPP